MRRAPARAIRQSGSPPTSRRTRRPRSPMSQACPAGGERECGEQRERGCRHHRQGPGRHAGVGIGARAARRVAGAFEGRDGPPFAAPSL